MRHGYSAWGRPEWLVAAGAWLLCGGPLWLWLLGSVLGRLQGGLLGIAHFDAYGTSWFYWYTERILLHGAPAGQTELFFFPWGKDLYGDTGANLLDAMLAVPFRALLGPTLGYNLFVLLGMLATGLAVGWVARALTCDPVAVGLAAALGSASPFSLVELIEGRPTQALLVFPALTLGVWLRLAAPGDRPRRSSWRLASLGGVVLALSGYQYWYYGIFLGMAGTVLGLSAAILGPQRRLLAGRFGLSLGLSLLLVLPGAAPMLQGLSRHAVHGVFDVSTWGLWWQRLETLDGHSVALYLWQPLRGQAGFLHQHAGGQEVFLASAHYTPVILLLALPVALWRLGRGRDPAGQRRAVAVLAGVPTLIALGPVILVGARVWPNPVYLGLAHLLPVFARLWWPGRAVALLAILGSAVVPLAVSHLGRWRWAAAVLLTAGLGWQLHRDQLGPLSTWTPDIPAAVSCLAQGPPGALIALPDSFAQEQILYQQVHQRPTLGGMNSMLTPVQSAAFQADNSFVDALLRKSAASAPFKPKIDPADRQAVIDLGYRYVAISWAAYDLPGVGGGRIKPDQARGSVRRGLWSILGPPVWDDPRMSLWDLLGEGSPCAGSSLKPDPGRVGRAAPFSRGVLDVRQAQELLWRVGRPAPLTHGRNGRPKGPDPEAERQRRPGEDER